MSMKPDESPVLEKETLVTENGFFDGIKTLISSWKFKVTIVLGFLLITISVIFFWQHIIAVMGMKTWANHANGKPIDCMIKDTNNDQYISCTALVNEQIVPLECATSIFNLGCRVNYGSANPYLKSSK